MNNEMNPKNMNYKEAKAAYDLALRVMDRMGNKLSRKEYGQMAHTAMTLLQRLMELDEEQFEKDYL